MRSGGEIHSVRRLRRKKGRSERLAKESVAALKDEWTDMSSHDFKSNPLVKIGEKRNFKIFLKFAYSQVRRGKLAYNVDKSGITVIMAVSLLLRAVNGKN